jgi:tetratricopeptide (TPR) repeat protein
MAHRPVASILILTATMILALPAKGQQNVNPNNDGAHVALGTALAKQGDLDGAIAEFREALRLNPRSVEAHDDQACGQAKQGGASRISENLRLSPCHDERFSALVAAAACSQIVDVYHVKSRRL